jgi:hypothetical protein
MVRRRRTDKPALKIVSARLTPQEYAAWKKAAGLKRLSDWIREQCNKAAKS